jgi:hypothetical protein
MKLKARTAPMPARPTPPAADAKKPTAPPVAAAKKSNPFGAASAVDTASKLQEMDLKKKEEPVKKVDMWKKEPVVNADVPKEPVKQEEVKVEQKSPVKEEGFTTVVAPTSKEEPPAAKATDDQPEASPKKSEEKEKKRRQPEKVNSRAAAFETSAPVSNPLLGLQTKVCFSCPILTVVFFLFRTRHKTVTEENERIDRMLEIKDLLLLPTHVLRPLQSLTDQIVRIVDVRIVDRLL